MRSIPRSIQKLIREFNKLPGIGSKTSERFVFHLLRQPKEDIQALASSLLEIKESIRLCDTCYTVAEAATCSICSDKTREADVVCVVAEPKDVMAFEKTDGFRGVYHVLGGVIDAAFGVGPADLRIGELVARVDGGNVKEVILALNPDMEGDTTAFYIGQQLKEKDVAVTKIARGLPTGANIEFADQSTLSSALKGRQKMESRSE